jgi:hypothetical protein
MVEQDFISAAKAGVLCELRDYAGGLRLVEPYMVYRSSRGNRLFHCYQITGVSESNRPTGWKNPEVASFASGTITTTTFQQRQEYNPENQKMFPVIYFALPKYGVVGG